MKGDASQYESVNFTVKYLRIGRDLALAQFYVKTKYNGLVRQVSGGIGIAAYGEFDASGIDIGIDVGNLGVDDKSISVANGARHKLAAGRSGDVDGKFCRDTGTHAGIPMVGGGLDKLHGAVVYFDLDKIMLKYFLSIGIINIKFMLLKYF